MQRSGLASLRRTAGDGRVLAAVMGLAVVELGLRYALVGYSSPFLFLFFPPVAAVAGLGLLVSYERGDLTGLAGLGDWLGSDLGPLALVAVVGHAFAVVVGGAIFLAVETPVRYVAYWLGYELLASPLLAIGVPFWGLGAGIALAWAGPALAVAGILRGRSLRGALGAASRASTESPRRVALVGAGLFGTAVLAGISYAIAYEVGRTLAPHRFVASIPGYQLTLLPIQYAAALGGILTCCLVTLPLAASGHYTLDIVATVRPAPATETAQAETGSDPGSQTGPSLSRSDLTPVVVALVLLVSLGTVGGAARLSQQRPVDTSPGALGDDPARMFETAVDNTETRGFHMQRTYTRGGDRFSETLQIDRRHMVVYRDSPDAVGVYFSPGTQARETDYVVRKRFLYRALGSTVAAGPTSTRVTPADHRRAHQYLFQSLASEIAYTDEYADELTVLERNEEEIILGVSDPTRVAQILIGEEVTDVDDVKAASIRVVIDSDAKTLERIHYRFDGAWYREGPRRTTTVEDAYTFTTVNGVDRPAFAGSPTAEERLWKLLVY